MLAGVGEATAPSDLIISNETGNPLLQIGRLSRESEEQSGSLSFISAPEVRAIFFFFKYCYGAAVKSHNRKKKKKRQLMMKKPL